MPICTKLLTDGVWRLSSVVEDGKDRVEAWLEDIEKKRPDLHRKVIGHLQYISQYGPHKSREKFRKEEGKIFAIKASQARLYCFYHGERPLCLTNGVVKKDDKADKKDLKLAERLRKGLLANE